MQASPQAAYLFLLDELPSIEYQSQRRNPLSAVEHERWGPFGMPLRSQFSGSEVAAWFAH